MGKIIGDKKKVVVSFTQEELNEITSNLNKKIAELTEEVDKKAKKDSKKENE